MLTRIEKERIAIALLKKDKPLRYVAKKSLLSLTVISALKKKLVGVEKSLLSGPEGDGVRDDRFTEAYQLFDKGKIRLIDVAIN